MYWLKSELSKFDANAIYDRIMSLQLEPTNTDCQLECVFLVAKTLSSIWEKRKGNKRAELEYVKAIVSAKEETLKTSSFFGSNGTNLLTMLGVE